MVKKVDQKEERIKSVMSNLRKLLEEKVNDQ